MIITKIERQKRNPRRVNIFLDDEFAFGIHEYVLTRLGLRKGDTINQETIEAIKSSEEYNLAKEKALRFINYRLRSEKELRLKLQEKEFQPKTIDDVLEGLRKSGIVNDARFAKAYIHDAQLRKPMGKKLLQQKLRLKGVPSSIIQEVLNESMNEEEEQSHAFKTAQKFMKSRKMLEPKQQQQRIAQFLARRGFSWSTISPVLRKLFSKEAILHEES